MKHIDDEIEKTLSSLDGLQRATPGEDFNRRLMERISSLPEENTWVRWLRYGVAAMVILGLANVFALLNISSNDNMNDLNTELVEEFYDSSSYFFENTN